MEIDVTNINLVHGSGVALGMTVSIDGGIIRSVHPWTGNEEHEGKQVLDGTGLWMLPAFADMHFRFRYTGFTHRDDIVPGASRAAKGGYSALCCMPDTSPPIDSPALVHDVIRIAKDAVAAVYPIAAVTHQMEGRRITHFDKLLKAGAIAFSDNGRQIADTGLMVEAMQSSQRTNSVVMVEEYSATETSSNSTLLRDLRIAGEQGGRLHICGVSTDGHVEAISAAKRSGNCRVTCDASPADFLSSSAGAQHNSSSANRGAVIKALMDGTIDAVNVARASHGEDLENDDHQEGALEAAFSGMITELYQPGLLSLSRIAHLLSTNPRNILGLHGGVIEPGASADAVICDIDTPFERQGKQLFGKVLITIRNGCIAYNRTSPSRR